MATANIEPSLTKYCPGCGKRLHLSAQVCPECGSPQQNSLVEQPRSRIVAAVLALFFGLFGIHKFYLGRKGAGLLYLIFFWTFIPGLLGLIDAIVLLLATDRDFHARYG